MFKYKIAFFTESPNDVRYIRNNPNRRTDISWQIAMDADNFALRKRNDINIIDYHKSVKATYPHNYEQYDIGILVIPKKMLMHKDDLVEIINFYKKKEYEEKEYEFDINILNKKLKEIYEFDVHKLNEEFNNILEKMKKKCTKIAVMQEGNSTYFHDYLPFSQIIYYNIISQVDFILCHNEIDKKFFKGFIDKPIYIMPTLMIDKINKENDPRISSGTLIDDPNLIRFFNFNKLNQIMLGGNFVSWYGGFSSYIISKDIEIPINIPRMGRVQENILDDESKSVGSDINYFDYKIWIDWMEKLAKVKYAVHMMPTVAAGSFSLNCAYLGIPCISNELLDTQRKCFPDLSVNVYDLEKAKNLLKKLYTDIEFYNECSVKSKENYEKYFSEGVFVNTMENIFEKELK